MSHWQNDIAVYDLINLMDSRGFISGWRSDSNCGFQHGPYYSPYTRFMSLGSPVKSTVAHMSVYRWLSITYTMAPMIAP